jgi:hypothetical protein
LQFAKRRAEVLSRHGAVKARSGGRGSAALGLSDCASTAQTIKRFKKRPPFDLLNPLREVAGITAGDAARTKRAGKARANRKAAMVECRIHKGQGLLCCAQRRWRRCDLAPVSLANLLGCFTAGNINRTAGHWIAAAPHGEHGCAEVDVARGLRKANARRQWCCAGLASVVELQRDRVAISVQPNLWNKAKVCLAAPKNAGVVRHELPTVVDLAGHLLAVDRAGFFPKTDGRLTAIKHKLPIFPPDAGAFQTRQLTLINLDLPNGAGVVAQCRQRRNPLAQHVSRRRAGCRRHSLSRNWLRRLARHRLPNYAVVDLGDALRIIQRVRVQGRALGDALRHRQRGFSTGLCLRQGRKGLALDGPLWRRLDGLLLGLWRLRRAAAHHCGKRLIAKIIPFIRPVLQPLHLLVFARLIAVVGLLRHQPGQ